MSTLQILNDIANFESLNRNKHMTPSRDEIRLLDCMQLTGAILGLKKSVTFDKEMFVDMADYYLEMGANQTTKICYEAALFAVRWSSRGDLANELLHQCHRIITQVEDESKWLHLVASATQKGFSLPRIGEPLLMIVERESSKDDGQANGETLFIAYEVLEVWIERNPGRLNDPSLLNLMQQSRNEMAFEKFLTSNHRGNHSFRVLVAGTFLRHQDDLYHWENADAIDNFLEEVDSKVSDVAEAAIAARLLTVALKARPDSFNLSNSRMESLFLSDETKFHSCLLLLLSRVHGTILRTKRILSKMLLDPIEGVEVRTIVRQLGFIPQPYFDKLGRYLKFCLAMGLLPAEDDLETKFTRAYDDPKLRSELRELIKEKRRESVTAGALYILKGEATLEFKIEWIQRLEFRGTLDAVKVHAAAFQYMEDHPENDLISDKDAERLKRTITRWLTVCEDKDLRNAIFAIPLKKLSDFY